MLISCKKDKDDPVEPCNYALEVQDELNAANQASLNYANNPTTANCNAFKAAWQAYLDELEDHVDCAALSGQQAQIQQAINDAQAAVDSVQC